LLRAGTASLRGLRAGSDLVPCSGLVPWLRLADYIKYSLT
jgi:hypothetical protein